MFFLEIDKKDAMFFVGIPDFFNFSPPYHWGNPHPGREEMVILKKHTMKFHIFVLVSLFSLLVI